jgi:sugar phosphate isomerase/epimerase
MLNYHFYYKNLFMASKIAAQMFTLREHTKTASDLSSTLKRITDIGYTAVQLSAVGCMNGENPEVDAITARKMLDDNGLKCIATHRGWGNFTENLDSEIEFHKTLGCDFTAIGGIPRDFEDTIAGYRRFLTDAKPVISALKAEGITFAHHNHAKEFYKEEPHGMTLEDVLIDEGGEDLKLELDLYWIEHSGTNCVAILERSHGRVPVVHIKDKEVIQGENNTRIAPIGEGVLDWDSIIAAGNKAGVEWFCVEQDQCYRDAFDCMKSSYDFLSGKGL